MDRPQPEIVFVEEKIQAPVEGPRAKKRKKDDDPNAPVTIKRTKGGPVKERVSKNTAVFVSGLPQDVTKDELVERFSALLTAVRFGLWGRATGACKAGVERIAGVEVPGLRRWVTQKRFYFFLVVREYCRSPIRTDTKVTSAVAHIKPDW